MFGDTDSYLIWLLPTVATWKDRDEIFGYTVPDQSDLESGYLLQEEASNKLEEGAAAPSTEMSTIGSPTSVEKPGEQGMVEVSIGGDSPRHPPSAVFVQRGHASAHAESDMKL